MTLEQLTTKQLERLQLRVYRKLREGGYNAMDLRTMSIVKPELTSLYQHIGRELCQRIV